MSNSDLTNYNSCKELRHIVPLDLPGFSKTVPPGSVHQLMFDPASAEVQFQRFVDRVVQSIGRHYLPIYRMADGEFMFAVGSYPSFDSAGRVDLFSFAKVKTKRILAKWRWTSRYGGLSTMWGESYSREELPELRTSYARYLKELADQGLLAIHFVRSHGRFGEQYIPPMCQWLKENEIVLNEYNYTSFYFVYALLNGPSRKELFEGRRIAVVSSVSQIKRDSIATNLSAQGAAQIQFLDISPTHSMTETIDLNRLSLPIDLVMVAAGVGSANILVQLKPLETVCIDSGICVECLADPKLKKERIFLLSDADVV